MAKDGDSWMKQHVTKYVLSVTAAGTAESVTYPMDLCKARLQIAGEHQTVRQGVRAGVLNTLRNVVVKEGFRALYFGYSAALLRHSIYTGNRLTIYEHLRTSLLHRQNKTSIPLWQSVICGGVAGSTAQLLASPADLMKVLLQTEGLRRVNGEAPRVHGLLHGFVYVWRNGGVLQLWRGAWPNCQRAALVNMTDIATYDRVKRELVAFGFADDWRVHALTSLCSGLTATLASTPADVVKTRMMNQDYRNGQGVLYKSSLDCLMKTVSNEGPLALYKGFIPIYARLGPWFLTFWVTYEQLRAVTGTKSF